MTHVCNKDAVDRVKILEKEAEVLIKKLEEWQQYDDDDVKPMRDELDRLAAENVVAYVLLKKVVERVDKRTTQYDLNGPDREFCTACNESRIVSPNGYQDLITHKPDCVWPMVTEFLVKK